MYVVTRILNLDVFTSSVDLEHVHIFNKHEEQILASLLVQHFEDEEGLTPQSGNLSISFSISFNHKLRRRMQVKKAKSSRGNGAEQEKDRGNASD